MLPTPNATFLRDDARCGHFTHASARSRNAAKAAALCLRFAARWPVAWGRCLAGSEQGGLLGNGLWSAGLRPGGFLSFCTCRAGGRRSGCRRLRQGAERFGRDGDVARATRFEILQMLDRRIEQLVIS